MWMRHNPLVRICLQYTGPSIAVAFLIPLLLGCILHAHCSMSNGSEWKCVSSTLAGYDNITPSAEQVTQANTSKTNCKKMLCFADQNCAATHYKCAHIASSAVLCITFADEGMGWNERWYCSFAMQYTMQYTVQQHTIKFHRVRHAVKCTEYAVDSMHRVCSMHWGTVRAMQSMQYAELSAGKWLGMGGDGQWKVPHATLRQNMQCGCTKTLLSKLI